LASWGACEALAVAFEEQGSDGLLKILQVIELHLSADGVGEGKIVVGTKVRLHRKDDLIELDNYAAGSILLKDVKAERKRP
jgi:hypothetical protein